MCMSELKNMSSFLLALFSFLHSSFTSLPLQLHAT
jgi:hypothetical protein